MNLNAAQRPFYELSKNKLKYAKMQLACIVLYMHRNGCGLG